MTTWHFAPVSNSDLDDLTSQIADLRARLDEQDRLLHNHGAEHATLTGSDPTRYNWRAYTPQLTAVTTDPTLGTGAVQRGRWLRVGNLVVYTFFIKFGTAGVNAGSGTYSMSVPTTIHSAYEPRQALGSVLVRDNSPAVTSPGVCRVQSPTTLHMVVADATAGGITLTDNTPWTWAASDELTGTVTYAAAKG